MSGNDLLLRPIAASPPGSGDAPPDPASVAYVSHKILAVPIDGPNGGIADLGDDVRSASAGPAAASLGDDGE